MCPHLNYLWTPAKAGWQGNFCHFPAPSSPFRQKRWISWIHPKSQFFQKNCRIQRWGSGARDCAITVSLSLNSLCHSIFHVEFLPHSGRIGRQASQCYHDTNKITAGCEVQEFLHMSNCVNLKKKKETNVRFNISRQNTMSDKLWLWTPHYKELHFCVWKIFTTTKIR